MERWLDSVPVQTLQVLTLVVQALTFLALLWYAGETRAMRLNAANQMRLSALPVVRVVFEQNPNKVILLNEGNGIVATAWLKGFDFQMHGDTFRCAFAPVHTIPQGNGRGLRIEMNLVSSPIDALQPHAGVPDPNAILFEAMSRMVTPGKSLVLDLYVMDVLGHSYRSEIRITFDWVMQLTSGITEQPETTRPVLVKTFPAISLTSRSTPRQNRSLS